jgi:uncharacterized membrane protein
MRAKKMELQKLVNTIGDLGDMSGVLIIATGFVWGALRFLLAVVRGQAGDGYKDFRLQLVRALLLGLEVLVASDIIRTVAVSPSLNSVAILAAIVLIRTFLSWSLILESEGRWPWQRTSADRTASSI